ncbi:MAG: DapH/DapD/GlmU-related protein [Dysgonomonas sp.]|nr:DapH/DapD/GlmU-related protein [Dysgonomonas sp.]
MKKIFLLFLKYFSRFIAFIFPYALTEKPKLLRNKIYTYWLTTDFKDVQGEFIIMYPALQIKGGKYINIGKNVGIGAHAILTAWDKYENDHFLPEITIGNNVWIGEDCHITAINKIKIGNNVLMGKKITISDNSHGKIDFDSLSISPIKRPLYSKGEVIIEDGVWIGDKVTILAGVRIGKNSIIGANALVTKDIPDNCVVGGVPAQIIKKIVG